MGDQGECKVCDADFFFFPGPRKDECYAIVFTITVYTIVLDIALASTFEGDRVWWRAGSG